MRPIVTTSWDDCHPLDLKLADLLAERGLRATFYCPPRNRERPVMDAAELRRLGESFEIGAHSLTHPDLRTLSGPALRSEIGDCRRELEDALGRPVDMFCYPKGRYDARVRRAVVECGFIGARTTRAFLLGPPRDPFLLPTTLPVRDSGAWEWLAHCARSRSWTGLRQLVRLGPGRPWHELARGLFEFVLERGGVWHLWGHSWEIEKHGMWQEVRSVLDTVSGRDGVDYLTNGEVVRRCQPPD